MAAMQVAPLHTQSPVSQGTYPVDSSRRQYVQQSPAADEQSQNVNARSPQTSSGRPSRRPSANDVQVTAPEAPYQPAFQSPGASYPSHSTTPRGQDMANVTQSSVPPTTALSPSYQQQSRRDQRAQPPQQGGPRISPPPRTSSSQRNTNPILPSNAQLVDRTVPPRPVAQTAPLGSGDTDFNDTTAAAANAARSRRRGPASPEGPQRAISTREASHQQALPIAQSRSSSHMPAATDSTRSARDDGQIINRVMVDDPAIDIRREQERQLESVPGLATVNNAAIDDVSKVTPRSRQDQSASSASGGRRKETRFGEYILGQTLGEGEFGKVKLGWKKGGEVQVAIKLIRRDTLGQNPSRLPKIYREVSILRGLEHPNIVKLHEMFETTTYIGIILEYASGGELFDYILNQRFLKDNTARKLFAQLVSGVGYLHKKGIVHRDLKLENLLLDRNRNIVITDFGFANTFNPNDELEEEIERNLTDRKYVKEMGLDRVKDGVRRGDLMATSCGSPCYAAPELVVTDSLYTGRKVDVWSVGVILYAMLAGYLPFDDDPANPEGDNINLLYKYITTTPLTFPEYVTPHARDLLRRILVPDPRQRADLWEVARHSWLLDYQHVVKGVTSSTTTVGDIQNATVTSDQQDAPLLVRSASVREPSKAHPTNMSPPGALSHQGNLDSEQVADKSRAQRDPKRRTVQVEYVAPQRQTTRGEPLPPVSSSSAGPSTGAPASQPRTRVRGATEGPRSVPSNYNAAPSDSKPLPQDPSIATSMGPRTYQASSRRQQEMAPPKRPPKDMPRSVSDSTSAFGQIPSPTATRPTTGGSMASTGPGRLPSRGNSYSQPLAPTVATTNAQARLSQPKNGKQYNISAPIPQSEPFSQAESIGRPSTQQYDPTLGPPQDQSRGHKRSNTLGNFFRTGSISGGRSQPGSPGEIRREKRYPPTSMKAPLAADSPRQSIDSRRPSFSFSRKSSKARMDSDQSAPEKPRRFSLLPASFSFRSFTTMGSSKDQSPEYRPTSERRQSSSLMQGPPGRAHSRPQTMGYGTNQGEHIDPRQGENPTSGFDGQRDRIRDNTGQQPRRKEVPSRGGHQNQHAGSQYQSQLDPYATRPPQPGQSYLGTPTESEISLNPRRDRPMYPQGFNSYEDEQPRPSMQQSRSGRSGVLQKNNRRFADAYDQNPEPGHGPGGQHSGTSGAAKRVMDFFRRRGKARAGEEKM